MSVATPVLLILFNRPDTTALVWQAIRAAQPPVLLIAADAARHPGEEAQVQAARAITEEVDWPCTVHRRYASTNQGCKWGVYNAISWGFELAEELIILEDDCLPHPDFFRFCDSMLERYRHEKQIMHIGGSSFVPFQIPESYYFSKYTHIWGWATWRRAWTNYDVNMSDWDNSKPKAFLKAYNPNKKELKFWMSIFNQSAADSIDNWDYQWTYHIWKSGGTCIVAAKNLVSNIGFGENATHTKNVHPLFSCREQIPLDNSFIHPNSLATLEMADQWMFNHVYHTVPKNIVWKFTKSLIKKFFDARF